MGHVAGFVPRRRCHYRSVLSLFFGGPSIPDQFESEPSSDSTRKRGSRKRRWWVTGISLFGLLAVIVALQDESGTSDSKRARAFSAGSGSSDSSSSTASTSASKEPNGAKTCDVIWNPGVDAVDSDADLYSIYLDLDRDGSACEADDPVRSNLVFRGIGGAPDEAAAKVAAAKVAAEAAAAQAAAEAEVAAKAAADQAAKSAADKAAKVSAPSSTYYANCSEAKATGAAPIYVGQPGYSTKLDRDKDGVACE